VIRLAVTALMHLRRSALPTSSQSPVENSRAEAEEERPVDRATAPASRVVGIKITRTRWLALAALLGAAALIGCGGGGSTISDSSTCAEFLDSPAAAQDAYGKTRTDLPIEDDPNLSPENDQLLQIINRCTAAMINRRETSENIALGSIEAP
jgi:hypothetical protein